MSTSPSFKITVCFFSRKGVVLVLLIEAIIVYVEAAFLILETIIGLTLVATLKG